MITFILIIIFIVLLFVALGSYYGESLDEKQNKINTQLNDLNIDAESYFLENDRMKIGIDVKQRKVFEVGLEYGTFQPKIQLIDLNNVIDVEIIEDNQVINKVSNSSMIGRAVVGGVLTGVWEQLSEVTLQNLKQQKL